MSDHIDRNGKRYYAEEYFLGLLKTSKRRRKRIEALEANIKGVKTFVESMDGMPGSQMWRIKKTILEALKQHPEPSAQKATLILGHPDGGPRDG